MRRTLPKSVLGNNRPFDGDWPLPDTLYGQRLRYHRTTEYLHRQRLNPLADYARVINMSLWKWADEEFRKDTVNVKVRRDDLMAALFPDMDFIKKDTVGRIINSALMYNPVSTLRIPGGREYCWHFRYIAELMYGMEVHILDWLPWFLVHVARMEPDQEAVTAERIAEEFEDVRSGVVNIEKMYGPEAEDDLLGAYSHR